ncbi:MAG: hypothetical protein H6744_15120 [Deltaproteobacteria bacterium]|nr:hypothetical protein [Deltaproteobacteria bacterium]MCB9788012.1 hypothetical protein [Deltaproteobacteria bacterium]
MSATNEGDPARGEEAVARATNRIRDGIVEARALLEELHALARLGKDASDAQRAALADLAGRLDADAREAARARRQAEIERLDEIIASYDAALAVDGLPTEVRDAVFGERTVARAKRTRLWGEAATDFGGVLTRAEVERLETLSAEVREATRRRARAASLLRVATRIVDVALGVVFKLAT